MIVEVRPGNWVNVDVIRELTSLGPELYEVHGQKYNSYAVLLDIGHYKAMQDVLVLFPDKESRDDYIEAIHAAMGGVIPLKQEKWF